MKKCASCTKDLPDAALHCVFCGAKQPPAPATQPAMAKTVMGYQAGDMVEQLRAQNAAAQAAGTAPSAPSTRPGPSQPPPVGMQNAQVGAFNATMPATPAHAPRPPVSTPPAPAAMQSGGLAPVAPANAATMFAPPAQPPAPPPNPFNLPPRAHAPSQPPPSGLAYPAHQPAPAPLAPRAHTPSSAPSPAATPPYLASQTAARAGRPIEPWRDSLRLMMFVWGALLLAAFATPLSLDPLTFNWDAVIHAGDAKLALPPLIMAAVGLLSIVIAAIPMSPGPRGGIAALLALAGVFVPTLVAGVPPWTTLVATVGMLILVPSLLVRHEYRDAVLPRVLITVGALAALVPWVVPQHDAIPLVDLFKGAIDAGGKEKIVILLVLVQIVVIVLSLLAWLPAPSCAMAKPLAWLLILWPLVMHVAILFLLGDPDMVTKAPFQGGAAWISSGGGPMGAHGAEATGIMAMLTGGGIGVAYLALVGYGGATVIGKNLE